jgi:hypothetical protein
MALTYLDLVNETLRRLNEVELTSSTFATATGFQSAVKDFVNSAIYDIHIAEMEWPFNRAAVTATPASGLYQFNLTPNTTGAHAAVDWDSFYSYDPDTNTTKWMRPLDFDEWRQRYFEQTAPFTATGQPERIVQVPNDDKVAYFWPPTDKAVYVINRSEFVLPSPLTVYTDTTTIPTQFRQVVIDRAMQYGYEFRSNTEMAARMDQRFTTSIKTMRTYLLNRFLSVRDARVNNILRRG